MAITGIAPIKQAFVRALRDIDDLKSAVGSDGIHEGVVPPTVGYPYVVYNVVLSRVSHEWGSQTLRTIVDVFVVSDDQVEAHNLDALIVSGLEDVVLDFSGTGSQQSSLLCHRTASMSLVDTDDEGNKVYQVGGTYEIWTTQTTA